jgi:hypothetical protein
MLFNIALLLCVVPAFASFIVGGLPQTMLRRRALVALILSPIVLWFLWFLFLVISSPPDPVEDNILLNFVLSLFLIGGPFFLLWWLVTAAGYLVGKFIRIGDDKDSPDDLIS